MDSIAYLIQSEEKQDDMGQFITEGESLREVFVTVESVVRSEFFEAGRNGLKPEYVLKMPKINYSGEKEMQYNGNRYSVYRTYCPPDSDDIELYVIDKAGVKND